MVSIPAPTDQDDNDSNLFGDEINDTNMSAAAALQTAIGGLAMAYIGMHRLTKTLPTDETANATENKEVTPFVVEKLHILTPSIRTLAEWLETINHAVFEMCIHTPSMEGTIQWFSVELNVRTNENGDRLAALMDMIQAQLN